MEEEVLGVVQFAKSSRDGGVNDFCRLRPTHIAHAGSWQPIANSRTMFPDQGLVFWFRPKPISALHEGSLWAFHTTEQPHYEPSANRHDRYQVDVDAAPTSPIAAITLPGIDNAKQLRRRLVLGAIQIQNAITLRVLIRIPGSKPRWLGPFPVQHVVSGSDSTTLTVPSGFAPVRVISDDAFQEIELGATRHRVLRPQHALSEPTEVFDVQSDAELFRSLMKRIKRWNPQVFQALDAAREIVDGFAATLAAAPIAEDERLRERARLEAARSVLGDFQQEFEAHSDLAQFLVQDLLEHPVVQESLDRQLREEQEARRLSLQAETDAQLAQARDAVIQLRMEERDEREKLHSLKGELIDAVDKILSDAIPKLAEHVIVQTVLARKMQASPAAVEVGVASTEMPSQAGRANVTDQLHSESFAVRELSSWDALRAATPQVASAHDIDPYVLGVLTCLMAGMGVTLLAGANAERMASAFAHLVAAGSARRVSISPTIFGVSDLMRAPCVSVCSGSDQVCALGDFLECVSKQDQLSVVILQGCNRAPLENIMLEVFEAATARRGAHRLAWVDEAGTMRGATIDARVLFLGTLTGGSAIFPVPKSMQHRIPVIWADREIVPLDLRATCAEQVPSRVAPNVWRALDWHSVPMKREPIMIFRQRLPFANTEASLAEFACTVIAAMRDADQGLAEALAALLAGRCQKDIVQMIGGQLTQIASGALQKSIAAGEAEMAAYFEGVSRS